MEQQTAVVDLRSGLRSEGPPDTPQLLEKLARLRMALSRTAHAVDEFAGSVESGDEEVLETLLSCNLANLLEHTVWVFTRIAPWHAPRVQFD